MLISPFLFTVHIRPVLSPCQAGNTSYILSCFFKKKKKKNVEYNKTIYTRNIDIIFMFSTAISLLGSQDFA